MLLRSCLFMLLVSLAFAGGAQPNAPPQDRFPQPERIIVIGDLHGDFVTFQDLLRTAKLIDEQDNWVAGATHLVQTGDVPARGTQSRKIYDLLMKLEQQALEAGGRVHFLIGNHDAMGLSGDFRSISREEFEEFKGPGSEELLEAQFKKELDHFASIGHPVTSPEEMKEFREMWFSRHGPGFVEYREAFSPTGKYGSWIRSHNAAEVIGDTLFVHAGISPKYANLSLREINEMVRKELLRTEPAPGITTNPEGPLWYRGLADEPEAKLAAHVDAVLKHFGADRIVTGHSINKAGVLPRFEGKVIFGDVGLSKFYGGPQAFIEILNGVPFAVHRGTRVPLPKAGKQNLLNYYLALAKLDPQPSPLQPLIEDLKVSLRSAAKQR